MSAPFGSTMWRCNLVSMPAVVFDHDDHPPGLPDDLKMPERAVHRQAVDVIALAATRLLGPSVRVFRDMNWYPADGGNATAPDIMFLGAEAVEPSPRSYRQNDGPPPLVVVEIPSDDDSFAAFRTKAKRAQANGSVVYIAVVDGPDPVVLRLGLDDTEFVAWTGRPLTELGNLRIDYDDGELTVVLPDGLRASTDADLVSAAEAKAEEAEARADEALARAGEMARLLREHGIDPG